MPAPTPAPSEALAAMTPEGRVFLARIGRRFGTREVLRQARSTLDALARCGEVLQPYGFSPADAELLAAAYAVASAQDSAARVKQTSVAYVHGLDQAKSARARARSVLLSAYRRLRMIGRDSEDARARIREVLAATSGPGGDDRDYARELEQLLAVLEQPAVTQAVASCGGLEARKRIEVARASLQALDVDVDGAEPSDVDALDGMIVELARAASFAAKVAANELGDRSLAKAFRLRLMS